MACSDRDRCAFDAERTVVVHNLIEPELTVEEVAAVINLEMGGHTVEDARLIGRPGDMLAILQLRDSGTANEVLLCLDQNHYQQLGPEAIRIRRPRGCIYCHGGRLSTAQPRAASSRYAGDTDLRRAVNPRDARDRGSRAPEQAPGMRAAVRSQGDAHFADQRRVQRPSREDWDDGYQGRKASRPGREASSGYDSRGDRRGQLWCSSKGGEDRYTAEGATLSNRWEGDSEAWDPEDDEVWDPEGDDAGPSARRSVVVAHGPRPGPGKRRHDEWEEDRDEWGYDEGGYDEGGYDEGGYDEGAYDEGGYDEGDWDREYNGAGPAVRRDVVLGSSQPHGRPDPAHGPPTEYRAPGRQPGLEVVRRPRSNWNDAPEDEESRSPPPSWEARRDTWDDAPDAYERAPAPQSKRPELKAPQTSLRTADPDKATAQQRPPMADPYRNVAPSRPRVAKPPPQGRTGAPKGRGPAAPPTDRERKPKMTIAGRWSARKARAGVDDSDDDYDYDDDDDRAPRLMAPRTPDFGNQRQPKNVTALLYEEAEALLPEGLEYIRGFLSQAEQGHLLQHIDRCPWDQDLTRQTQQYGFRFDYETQRLQQMAAPNHVLPPWMNPLVRKLRKTNLYPYHPDQVIINEYKGDQGISSHIDKKDLFDSHIAAVSLNGFCSMIFQPPGRAPGQAVALLLEPGSLLVMAGPARSGWFHSIPRVTQDVGLQGRVWKRTRRVSLTFRKTLPGATGHG